uniref:Methyltransf_FA domain-containing protein n=1 Tax=Glossina austeni TaxID=7395 RepID=A0A1A9VIN5_GLOAU
MSDELGLPKKVPHYIPLYGTKRVTFTTQKCSQIHIIFTKSLLANEGEEYEVTIVGGPKGKLRIQKKGTPDDATEISGNNFLKFNEFFIDLEDNTIAVGHTVFSAFYVSASYISAPYISLLYSKGFVANFMKVNCDDASSISCRLEFEEPIEFITPKDTSYHFVRLNSQDDLHFEVRCAGDARLLLTQTPEAVDPKYEIIIGGWGNTKSAIINSRQETIASISSPNILSERYFQKFKIAFENKAITLSGMNKALMCCVDENLPDFFFLGVRTGPNIAGTWKLSGPYDGYPEQIRRKHGSCAIHFRGPFCHAK